MCPDTIEGKDMGLNLWGGGIMGFLTKCHTINTRDIVVPAIFAGNSSSHGDWDIYRVCQTRQRDR